MKKLTYKQSGVDYDAMDPLKRMAQIEGQKTVKNLKFSGFQEYKNSRGESAYVVEGKDSYFECVEEGLGTKSLIADDMRSVTGKTYYDSLAQDTVAMIVNDLITVGAQPITVLAYWAVGNSNWFNDKKRMEDLTKGWAHACNLAEASWGGGETPTLKGIIKTNIIDLAGAAFGIIKPKQRLTLGDELQAGDAIILFQSSGIHANGLTIARKIGSNLPKKYATKISDGEMYGEALLNPTIIYTSLIRQLFEEGIRIHYMVNITGHGWRKIMRHSKNFTYRIRSIPPVPKVIQFIMNKGPVDIKEAYANFNMGAGFAVFVPQKDIKKTIKIAEQNHIKAYNAGSVEKGQKQIIIEPLKIVYKGDLLKVKA